MWFVNQELLVLVCYGSHEFDELFYRQPLHRIVPEPQS